MNTLQTDTATFRRWIGSAVVILLFACTAIVHAQEGRDKKKKDESTRPAGNAAQTAPQPHGAANARSGQSAQQNAGRSNTSGSGQGTQQNTGRSSTPGSGQGGQQNAGRSNSSGSGQGAQQNTGRSNASGSGQGAQQNTGRSNASGSGQGTQQNAGRSNTSGSGQGTQQNAGRSSTPGSGQGTQQNAGRSSTPGSGQGAQQNTGRSSGSGLGQGTQQNAGRSSGSGLGQGTQQNLGRPDHPNTIQPGRDQGRPGFQNPGQNVHQNLGQHPPDSRGGGPRPQTIRTSNGGMVHRDAGGQVRQVHTPGGAVITHRSDGSRRIEMARPGNRTIVTNAHGRGGYIQRPLMVSNRQYIQRTYSVHGVVSARVFRPVTYRGVSMHVYTPMHYYRPAFYSYLYNPWARPIFYDWAWSGRPWYGYYRGYFTPYPSYASPTLWLTDYLIGSVLEQAYEARTDSAGFAGGQVGITPDVKQAIADEVRRQLDLERSEGQSQNAASGDVLPMFADNARHVFVVSDALEVSSSGGECMISAGDVLQLYGAPPSTADTADVVVLASKGTDCRRGSIASVPIQGLQEMQNDMRATIDQGLADFQARHGKSGLPALPPSAEGVVNASFAASVTPDANVATELTQVAQEADRTEQDVVNQANTTGSSNGPVTISYGQTIEEVVAILSQPEKIVDLGAKKIYVYKDMKITFTDGKVSDVQ
jgi:hypothetical protein